jgi:hypothetical protein
MQAKLYEVMTSSETHQLPTPLKPETPWMVDGGGMPDNSLALMKKLVRILDSFHFYLGLIILVYTQWDFPLGVPDGFHWFFFLRRSAY